MRILMITPRFPYPADRGDTVRTWAVFRGLAERHDVWLASVDRAAPHPESLQHVRALCRDVAVFARGPLPSLARGALAALLGESFTEGYFHDARLARTVRDWCARHDFDAVLTCSTAVAPAARHAPARRRVLDMCDVDSAKWLTYAKRSALPHRAFYRREARQVALLESRTARTYHVTLLANERERQKFAVRNSDVTAGVLPTVVDLAEFKTAAPLPQDPVVGMIGSMFYPPNVRAVNWFGRYVWPEVKRALPAAQWLIVGRRPARSVRQWSRLPGVTVTGYVPDVRPFLDQTRCIVNAVDNDLGVQSKLVVAMAAGRPAVVTPKAAGGLVYDDPPPFVVVGSPRAFAEAVVRVLRDDAFARGLATRARAVAEAHYGPEQVVRRMEYWLGVTDDAPPAPPQRSILQRSEFTHAEVVQT
jgi:sugar transferase (PEP-CTERM/EpsH1 system associated)